MPLSASGGFEKDISTGKSYSNLRNSLLCVYSYHFVSELPETLKAVFNTKVEHL